MIIADHFHITATPRGASESSVPRTLYDTPLHAYAYQRLRSTTKVFMSGQTYSHQAYFYPEQTSRSDLRDIHVTYSSSPARPYYEGLYPHGSLG